MRYKIGCLFLFSLLLVSTQDVHAQGGAPADPPYTIILPTSTDRFDKNQTFTFSGKNTDEANEDLIFKLIKLQGGVQTVRTIEQKSTAQKTWSYSFDPNVGGPPSPWPLNDNTATKYKLEVWKKSDTTGPQNTVQFYIIPPA